MHCICTVATYGESDTHHTGEYIHCNIIIIYILGPVKSSVKSS